MRVLAVKARIVREGHWLGCFDVAHPTVAMVFRRVIRAERQPDEFTENGTRPSAFMRIDVDNRGTVESIEYHEHDRVVVAKR